MASRGFQPTVTRYKTLRHVVTAESFNVRFLASSGLIFCNPMRKLLHLFSLWPVNKTAWVMLTLVLFALLWLPPFDFYAFAEDFFDPAEQGSLHEGIRVVLPIALALFGLTSFLGWLLQGIGVLMYARWVYPRLVRRHGPGITLGKLLTPRRLWAFRKFRFSTYAGGTCLALLLFLGVLLRITSVADVDAYRGMAAECHPVWRAFACRQFSLGDSAAELARVHPPTESDAFGRYTILRYDKKHRTGGGGFTSFSVVSRDGQLIAAGAASCTWRLNFFDTKDPQLDREYLRYREAMLPKREDL